MLKTITRKENVFISWVMRLLIVVSLAWTGWAITLVFYLLTVIAFWMTRNQIAQRYQHEPVVAGCAGVITGGAGLADVAAG